MNELIEPINKLLVPIATSAGETLQNAWNYVFGRANLFFKKKQLALAMEFKNSVENNVTSIPAEHIQEPSMSIIGPALEASKYYFEEEELREMFANLVSAALDFRMNEDIHPSFTEVIKQMSTLDAQNLALIGAEAPVVEYRAVSPDGESHFALLSNVFMSHPTVHDPKRQSISITSLVRLGLLSITYGMHLSEENYNRFDCIPICDELRLVISKMFPGCSLSTSEGLVCLTPFGEAFKHVCLR